MSVLTAAQSRAFIRDARLPGLRAAKAKKLRAMRAPEKPLRLQTTGAQALIVGSGLVVAADGVPAQTRADIVNCTLFAQLAASGSVSQKSNVAAWYDAYFGALTALGWAQSDRRFEKFATKSTKLEAHQSIIKVLTTLLGPGAAALAVVAETFDALKSMNENSPWITLFDQQSTAASSARFQVATAQLTPGGLVDIALVAFDLKSRVTLKQLLFFKFKSSSTKLQYASGNATIYEEVLAANRQAVAARLQAYRDAFIGQVKFPPAPGAAVRRSRRRRAAG